MKVAVYINDTCHCNLDYKNPQLGNCGTGASEYEVVMLVYALVHFTDVIVNLYHHNNTNKYPDGARSTIVNSPSELYNLAKAHGNSILIFDHNSELIANLTALNAQSHDMKYIVWLHNYASSKEIHNLSINPDVKRIVFVGLEHYHKYLDDSVMKKSVPIFNMFDGKLFRFRKIPLEPTVTYTGGLYPVKGFHILASMWKDILREVPDAKLYVIGSGKLYGQNIPLGSLGVARPEYEAIFADSLMQDGNLLPSVNFLGVMGQEQSEIYYKTTVGVMNPSGASETLGMSSICMEACGIPVVSRAYGGLFDAIKHGQTGFLGKNPEAIKRYIVMLLKDKELNLRLGRQAKSFVEETFAPEKLVKEWLKIFDDVINNKPCKLCKTFRKLQQKL